MDEINRYNRFVNFV